MVAAFDQISETNKTKASTSSFGARALSFPSVSANPVLPHQTTRHPVLNHFPASLSDNNVPPSHPLPHLIPTPYLYSCPDLLSPIPSSPFLTRSITFRKMGICISIDSSSVSTAKLILPDGTLQQYTHPVKADYVLQRLNTTSFCICNSDEMDFNDVVTSLGDNEVLQLGELYFLLPVSVLKHPMKAAEMAELAVRASSALMESCGGNAWLNDENVNVKSNEKRVTRRRVVEDGGRRRRRGRTYSTDLSSIAE